jgi:integrase
MARKVRDATLDSRTARAKLAPRGKPYWRVVEEGLHIGYRRLAKGGGKWVMRSYAGDGAYTTETIGTADDVRDADGATVLSFGQAQTLARDRFTAAGRLAAGLPAKAGPYTVRQCVGDYLAWIEEHRKSARVIRWTAEASILPTLGDRPCVKLTSDEIRKWHEEQAKEPARLRTKKGAPQNYRHVGPEEEEEERRRRRATANRKLVILKAALNRAWKGKKIPSDEAWRAVQPYREVDTARLRWLSLDECCRLVNAADLDLRKLIQAALHTGCRYAELAGLLVADFNPDSRTLWIGKSKGGKARHVVLTEEGALFFAELAAGRSSQDRLLPKADGSKWLKSHQTRPMKEACERARIKAPASFHTLRHTWASLSVMGGMPLVVVAKNLGHSDTRMVEKHYGHLCPDYVAKAIREFAPRFGFTSESNVTPIGAKA